MNLLPIHFLLFKDFSNFNKSLLLFSPFETNYPTFYLPIQSNKSLSQRYTWDIFKSRVRKYLQATPLSNVNESNACMLTACSKFLLL